MTDEALTRFAHDLAAEIEDSIQAGVEAVYSERQQPRVARYDASGFVDKDGNRKAPLANRCNNLIDLLVGMGPGIANIWRQRSNKAIMICPMDACRTTPR